MPDPLPLFSYKEAALTLELGRNLGLTFEGDELIIINLLTRPIVED